MADQALSVGGMFLVNLVLARTQSKQEYGVFALSYSVLVFLLGLQNAAILEPFTVFGSGRYSSDLPQYFRLMFWCNIVLAPLMALPIVSLGISFRALAAQWFPRGISGLVLALSALSSAALLRRVFYLQKRANLAATASTIFFLIVMAGLWLTANSHVLNGSSVFLILSAGWLVAGLALARSLPFRNSGQTFLQGQPGYWSEHWKYAHWVLLTALIFQLTTQAYYWLVAGLLSVRDVAELKAIALLVAPADQIFIALNYLVLPLLCSHHAAGRTDLLLSAWRWYAIAISSATLMFFLIFNTFGKTVTHVLYGGRYDEAAPLLSLMLLLPVVMGIGHTMNAALKAAESPRLVFWAYAASAAVTFVAGVPLVAKFGLRGAVYGMLLSASSYTVAMAVGFVNCFSRKTAAPAAFVQL